VQPHPDPKPLNQCGLCSRRVLASFLLGGTAASCLSVYLIAVMVLFLGGGCRRGAFLRAPIRLTVVAEFGPARADAELAEVVRHMEEMRSLLEE
jgi:hypothetical protein